MLVVLLGLLYLQCLHLPLVLCPPQCLVERASSGDQDLVLTLQVKIWVLEMAREQLVGLADCGPVFGVEVGPSGIYLLVWQVKDFR